METFAVVEDGEQILDMINTGLRRWSGARPASGQQTLRLLVVSPRAAADKLALPDQCRTVLLPGHAGEVLSRVHAAAAVSYGTGPRDTLALSSQEGERLSVALQRELVTVKDQIVERQEFQLCVPPPSSALSALAAVGALLLLGVPPEHLTLM